MQLKSLVLSLIVVFNSNHFAVQPALATSLDNIPGIPLTSSTISSTIGGATYDHVYSLQVQAGTVLLLTLRGDAGAELGLYIFGEDAESVYSSEPMFSSAVPGGDQVIATQFFRDNLLYINVNGRNIDRAYAYQLNISAVVDKTPPIIRSATVRAYSRPKLTCVEIDAVDGLSGVQSVAIMRDVDLQPVTWLPYTGANTYCSEVESQDGPLELVVAARNKIGLVSFKVAGMTSVDSVAPRLLRIHPADKETYSPKPILSWRFSEPIKSTTRGASRVIAATQLGDFVSGRVWLSADYRQLYWQPTSNIKIGTMFTVVPAMVKDRAGNTLDRIDPIVLVRKVQTKIALEIVKVGRKNIGMLIRSSQNLVGKSVKLFERRLGEWFVIEIVQISASETKLRVPRSNATRYRAEWIGSDRLAGSSAAVSGRPLSP